MNLPNKLSLIRLFSVPAVVIVLALPDTVLPAWLTGLIGAALFIAASVTDALDGKIARRDGLVTDFGKLIDPLADKFMVLGALVMLLFRAETSAWRVWLMIVLVVVLFRELAVTSLRLLIAGKSGIAVPAKMIGKIKTVVQIVFVSTILIEPALYLGIAYVAGLEHFILCDILPISWAALAATLIITVWSGIDYIVSLWKYVETK